MFEDKIVEEIRQIRRATIGDVSAITNLVKAAYSNYLPRMYIPPEPMLLDYSEVIANNIVFVGVVDEDVVGVLVISAKDRFLIENVAVCPEYQNKGIGKSLLEFAEHEAARQGYSSVNLYTNYCMIENRRLYAHLGYIEHKQCEQKGYSRVFMQKQLS